MREARLWRYVREKIVCQLCWRFCKIADGESGFCKVRVNVSGKLYTLTYGKLSALESRPIEIKPFFHFKPGSTSMTFSTYSCNFECPWCQNWRISKALPPDGEELSPNIIVREALKCGDTSTCASLNEPTLLFEYLLEVYRIAKERGLMNTMVSNGYLSIIALDNLHSSGLNAMNVDVKGDAEVYEKYCGGKVEFVWRTIERALKLGIHVEVICLLVTDVNDDEETIRDVVENHLTYAGSDIPLHFTRYFPAYLFNRPPTKVERLERAVEIAKREGLNFVYTGNVPGHRYENTYCPECDALLIRRYSWRVIENRIDEGVCWKCGYKIYGVW